MASQLDTGVALVPSGDIKRGTKVLFTASTKVVASNEDGVLTFTDGTVSHLHGMQVWVQTVPGPLVRRYGWASTMVTAFVRVDLDNGVVDRLHLLAADTCRPVGIGTTLGAARGDDADLTEHEASILSETANGCDWTPLDALPDSIVWDAG